MRPIILCRDDVSGRYFVSTDGLYLIAWLETLCR